MGNTIINLNLNVTINVTVNFGAGLDQEVLRQAQLFRDPLQAAMAGRYGEIVRGNFGPSGVDRPEPWPLLSPAYARRVRRIFATLFVSGRLYEAVKVDAQAGRVSVANSEVPYALAHQYGNPDGHLPARPYFPFDRNGQPTAYTLGAVTQAAQDAVKNVRVN